MGVKNLPASITSYDLLKTFAVLTMVVDHFGIYFFPDEMWWRTIGRLSFPVWLFLIGYARSRDVSPRLIGGAAIVFVSNIVAGMGLLPLSILVSIIVVRLSLDPVMKILSKSAVHLWAGSAVLFVVALPSFVLFEFGALAFVFAIFGYLVRHQKDEADRRLSFQYGVFACLGYIFLQSLGYGLFEEKLVVLSIGVVCVVTALYKFKPKEYPEVSSQMSGVGRGFVKICGRYTLEIYVFHLLLFKMIAVLAGVAGFKYMQWSWIW